MLIRRSIPWTQQPEYPVPPDLSNPIFKGLTNLVVSHNGKFVQLVGTGLVINGTIATKPSPAGIAGTNNGEIVASGVATNYLSLPVIDTSALSVLFYGLRYSTPPANNVAVGAHSRSSNETAGFEFALGNGYGDSNLVYWNCAGASTGDTLYADGVKAVGANPSNISVTNGRPMALLGTFTTHTIGAGHTVLAKAAADGDFAYDVGCLIYATWNRQLSDVEGLSITRQPNQFFQPQSRIIYVPSAGGAAALAGNSAAASSASGAITTAIPIIGAAATVSTAAGALSASISMLGDAVVTATAAGNISAQIRFEGAAIAQSLAAAGIVTGIPLAGAAASVSSATGSLESAAALAGAAQAISAATGSITVQIMLSGAALSDALASGALTAPGSGLAGAATGLSSASGGLITEIPLIGTAQSYASAAGGLTTIIPLAGAAASVSSATGNLVVSITLTGAAIAQALAGGLITTQIVFSGAAVSIAAAAGVLAGGSAVVDNTWLTRPRARRYLVTPKKRIYKGSR